MKTLRTLLTLALGLYTTTASAQPPAPAAPAAPAPAPAPAAPAPSAPAPSAPAPAPAPSAPAPAPADELAPERAVPIRDACTLVLRTAPTEETLEAARLVCEAVSQARQTPSMAQLRFEVRLIKFGGKTILRISALAADGARIDERHIAVGQVDEVEIAAPRLLEALRRQVTPAETRNAMNVVEGDQTADKKMVALVEGWVAVTGGIAPTPELPGLAGIDGGLLFGSRNLQAGLGARLSGGGTDKTAATYHALYAGVRYQPWSTDTSPFVGGGVALAFSEFEFTRGGSYSSGYSHFEEDAVGAGTFAELGLHIMRARHIGGFASLRADLPLYTLQQVTTEYPNGYMNKGRIETTTIRYPAVLSANFGFSFR